MSIPGSDVPLLLAQPAVTGYQIQRSLRFNSSDSAFLSKTYSTARSGTDCTLSFWIKRHKLDTDQVICATARSGSNFRFLLKFTSSNQLYLLTAGGYSGVTFNPVLRDCSAWYHIHWKLDTINSIWINGVEHSSSGSTSGLHEWHTHVDAYSNVMQHGIGYHPSNIYETPAPDYGNYTLAEFHSLDNINAPVSSFGETNATTGQWVPKAYTGGYGNNGFRLTFSDNSGTTATTLGKDAAGSNNWTPTNFSVASGAGNDSLVDTPTSYGTDTGAGGEVRGNYATLNPLTLSGSATISAGNLRFVANSAAYADVKSTIGATTGKWYAELNVVTRCNSTDNQEFGIFDGVGNPRLYATYNNTTYTMVNGASNTSTGVASNSGDVMQVAYDADTGKVWLGANGTWFGSGNPSTGANPYVTITANTQFFFYTRHYGTSGVSAYNFGQRSWAYAAPSGFKALCDTNLPAPVVAKPSTVMDVVLYTGNSTDNRAITGLGFSPDLVWFGPRSQSGQDKVICDSVRGVQKALFSNQTYVEANPALYGSVGSFDSAGFTIKKGTDATFGFHQVNLNSSTYAAWCWDAGSSTVTLNPGDPGAGSITSQVRANASAGFSIVTMTLSGGNTIGHGLGIAPSLIILKKRSGASGWPVYHSSLGGTKALELNSTSAVATNNGYWNDANPTSTVFTTGSFHIGDYVAYCFAPVAGYSSFGSYTGNGSTDGPFVYTGFRPRWVMLKQSSGSGTGWQIHDTSRNTYNVMNNRLQPNNSDAESTYTTSDFLSNGFKLRDSDPSWNSNGATYIYAAFAENPFAYARAR